MGECLGTSKEVVGTGAIGRTEDLDGGTDNHFGRSLLHCAHGEPRMHTPDSPIPPPTQRLQHARPSAATQRRSTCACPSCNRRDAIDTRAGNPICREGGRVSDERRQGHEHAEEHRLKRMLHIYAETARGPARSAGLTQPLRTTHFAQIHTDIASTGRCFACQKVTRRCLRRGAA